MAKQEVDSAYENEVTELAGRIKEKPNPLGKFPKLIIKPGNYYVDFEDPEVRNILINHEIGDGTGILSAELKEITNIGTWF